MQYCQIYGLNCVVYCEKLLVDFFFEVEKFDFKCLIYFILNVLILFVNIVKKVNIKLNKCLKMYCLINCFY